MLRNIISQYKDELKSFHNSLTYDFPFKILITSVSIFIILLFIFSLITPDAFEFGDPAIYTQLINNSEFSHAAVHLGYYVLGVFFTKLLPFSDCMSLNIMNCFFGAAIGSIFFLLVYMIIKNYLYSLISVLFLTTNYYFIYNTLYAEVYISQTFFIVLALFLWLRSRPIFTGVSLVISYLISPSTLFALPAFFFLRPFFKDLVKITITFGMFAILLIYPLYSDYLYGDRGLLTTGFSINLVTAVIKELYQFFIGFLMLLPLLYFGLKEAILSSEKRIFVVFLFILFLITLIFVERFLDVPVQLATFIFLYVFLGFGLERLKENESQKTIKNYQFYIIWTCLGILISIVLFIVVKTNKFSSLYEEIPIELPIISIIVNFLFLFIIFLFVKIKPVLLSNHINIGIIVFTLCINFSVLFFSVKNQNLELNNFKNTTIELVQKINSNAIIVGNWNENVLFEYYFNQLNSNNDYKYINAKEFIEIDQHYYLDRVKNDSYKIVVLNDNLDTILKFYSDRFGYKRIGSFIYFEN